MAKKKESQLKVVGKEATVTVTRTILKKPTTKQTKIQIRPFVTANASISLKYGRTIPTEEYGNAKVDVMVTCPCYVEEAADVFKQVKEFVDERICKEIDEITGGSDGEKD